MARLLIAAAAAAAALIVCSGAAAAPADAFGAVAFYPFSLDAGNGDCVAVTEPGLGATHDCDPVNLVFPGQDLATVVGRLHAAGWSDVTGGVVQWLFVGDASLVATSWQLERKDGPDPTQRYHVRLWQAAPALTLGNVHHEHGTPHAIDLAWDSAEAFLANGVCGTWCGRVMLPVQAEIQGAGLWRGWANDSTATVLPLAPPPPPAAPAPAPPHRAHHRRKRHTPA